MIPLHPEILLLKEVTRFSGDPAFYREKLKSSLSHFMIARRVCCYAWKRREAARCSDPSLGTERLSSSAAWGLHSSRTGAAKGRRVWRLAQLQDWGI